MRNTRWPKWMVLNVGDPLYAPLPNVVPLFHRPLEVKSLLLDLRDLWLPQSSTEGGSSVTATVFLHGNSPDGGITIQLSSDLPDVAAVPATVFIPEGVAQADFAITTSPVAFSTNVNIKATFLGAQVTTTLTVVP